MVSTGNSLVNLMSSNGRELIYPPGKKFPWTPRRSSRDRKPVDRYVAENHAESDEEQQVCNVDPQRRKPAIYDCKTCNDGTKHYRDECPRWARFLKLEAEANSKMPPTGRPNKRGDRKIRTAHIEVVASEPDTDTEAKVAALDAPSVAPKK
jgi:hypothetical protein